MVDNDKEISAPKMILRKHYNTRLIYVFKFVWISFTILPRFLNFKIGLNCKGMYLTYKLRISEYLPGELERNWLKSVHTVATDS